MMKHRWSYYLILFLTAVVLIFLAPLSFKSLLPSGKIDIQLVPVLAVALIAVFDWRPAGGAVVVSLAVLLLLHWLSWPDLVILLIDLRAIICLKRFQPHPSALQSRLFSITLGPSQVVGMTGVYLIIAWLYSHQLNGLVTYFGQVFPVALLSGLLYTLLTAPLINFLRWLLKLTGNFNDNFPPAANSQGSVEINLGSSKKDSHDHDDEKR